MPPNCTVLHIRSVRIRLSVLPNPTLGVNRKWPIESQQLCRETCLSFRVLLSFRKNVPKVFFYACQFAKKFQQYFRQDPDPILSFLKKIVQESTEKLVFRFSSVIFPKKFDDKCMYIVHHQSFGKLWNKHWFSFANLLSSDPYSSQQIIGAGSEILSDFF